MIYNNHKQHFKHYVSKEHNPNKLLETSKFDERFSQFRETSMNVMNSSIHETSVMFRANESCK